MLVATAGHVDHGKTSLVRTLTGVNTDRLDEERRRGLTIELGFAFKNIDERNSLGFVDVPGHQRFMNTMISGITGIDLGMLVVAADDGPMPQTYEHLQVLRLLGVENFLAVITKIDLVDDLRVDNVAAQIQSLLPDTEICKISTQTEIGIDQLRGVLLDKAATLKTRQTRGHFRMYVDRAFTKKGSGVVVTGTALSGEVDVGDELFLHSVSEHHARKTSVKVRNIHVQGDQALKGQAGQRCALNLAGKISIEHVRRGDILFAGVDAVPTVRLDAGFQLADDAPRPLKHMGRVKLNIGARRIGARTYLLPGNGKSESENGRTRQRVQFILDAGVLAFAGDRFLVREDNEQRILGGGVIIDPEASPWNKANADRVQILDALEGNCVTKAFEKLLFEDGEIISRKRQQRIWNLTNGEIEHLLSARPFSSDNIVKTPHSGDQLILSAKNWELYKSCLHRTLSDWHKANSAKGSIAIDQFRVLLSKRIPHLIFFDVLNDLIRAGKITQSENQVRISGYRPQVSVAAEKDWARLQTLMQNRLPLHSEIQKELGFDARKIETLTRARIKAGLVHEIGEKRLTHSSTLRGLADQIAGLARNGPFTVIDAKKVFGLGRNQTIEVLEFFDTLNYTVRTGNARIVARQDVIETKLKVADSK